MSNLFTNTTVLLTEEFIKSCSKEILQSKLTKLRLVTGIQFSKANKSFAVTGSWDQVDAAFEILTHWQTFPDHEPDFENNLDGEIAKLCHCDIVNEFYQKCKLHDQTESESRLELKDTDIIDEIRASDIDLSDRSVEILEKEYARLKDKLKFKRSDLKPTGKKCDTPPDYRPLKCKILTKHKREVEQRGCNKDGKIADDNAVVDFDKNDWSLKANDNEYERKVRGTVKDNELFAVGENLKTTSTKSSINRIEKSKASDSNKISKSVSLLSKESENSRQEDTESNDALPKNDGNVSREAEKKAPKKTKKPGDKGYWSRAKRTDGDQTHSCSECNVTLKSRKRYLEHMRRIHIREYQCTVCERRFGYPTDLNRHKCLGGVKVNERNNTMKDFKAKTTTSSESVEFQCLECSYITTNKNRLSGHIQRKHRKEFPCDQCERRFGYSKDLQKHVENIHSDRRYFCDQCSKMYKNKQIFDSHLKTHETGYVKPFYDCVECSKSFTSKYSLAVHMRTVHLGIKRTYLCQMCGKKFTQRGSYKQHCNAHNGVKPYKCDVCGKAFVYHKSLKEHKYMHDNIRRFFCAICDKAFRQRTTLHIHLKTHKAVKDHICPVCGRGFAQKQAMERHERIHTGVRPYTCLVCNKSFGDTSTIRRHMITLHRKSETNWREEILSTVKKKTDYYVYGGTGQNRVYISKPSKKYSPQKKKNPPVTQSKTVQLETPVLQTPRGQGQSESSLLVLNPIQNVIQDPKFDYVNLVNDIHGSSLNNIGSNGANNFQTIQTLQPAAIYAIATSQEQQNQQQNQNSSSLTSPVLVDNGFSQVIDFSTMTFVTAKLPNQSNDKFDNREQNIQTPLLVQGQNTNMIHNATMLPQNATIVPLSIVSDSQKTSQTGPTQLIQASADLSNSQSIASVWGFVGYPPYQSNGNLTQYPSQQNQ